jgi:hypothetical protein
MLAQSASESVMGKRESSFEKILPCTQSKGNFTIKQATIEYGQVYKTDPVKITVTAAVEQPRDPNDTSISVDDNLYLIADISKTNPYVNERVYKLYFSNIGINNLSEVNKPKYNDF